MRPRVLVLCLAEVGPEIAGTAIRAVEIARALSAHADVTVASVDPRPGADLGLPVVAFNRHEPGSLTPHLQGVATVIGQPQWPLITRELARSKARLIFDLYCPEALETLDRQNGMHPLRRRVMTAVTMDRLTESMRAGHHFVAASERQLDLWRGVMLAERLIRPRTYDEDPSLGSRLGVVPYGLPEEPPAPSGGPGLNGPFPQIGEDDEIVMWTSGIWEWLDAQTPIRAMALLAERRPSAKLVFMAATDRPSARGAQDAARRLARELGLLGSSVLFHDGWVPYDERADWLLRADCAVACHERHLETRYSFRVRYFDCFWAGLPLVCTEGDVLAERVEHEGLGATVPERDPVALAAAIERVLDRGRAAHAPALARVAAEYRWSRAVQPLVGWLNAPLPARFGAGVPRRPGHRLRNSGYAVGAPLLRRRARLSERQPRA